jgi:hypothetical protein
LIKLEGKVVDVVGRVVDVVGFLEKGLILGHLSQLRVMKPERLKEKNVETIIKNSRIMGMMSKYLLSSFDI